MDIAWAQELEKDGRAVFEGLVVRRGPWTPGVDTGRWRFEGDTVCVHYPENFLGMDWCWTVFRNPVGTAERKDEYIMVSAYAALPLSRTQ